jgi:hypothetical protein
MPITSDQVITVINIALNCLEKSKTLKTQIQKINDEVSKIPAYYFLLEETEKIKEKIINKASEVMMLSDNGGHGFGDSEIEDIQTLMYMKARFEINKKKNSSAARRMQSKRLRDKETSDQSSIMKSNKTLDQNQNEDREFYKQRGQELHPQLGACDGEPCRKCQEKQKIITDLITQNAEAHKNLETKIENFVDEKTKEPKTTK